VDCTNPDRLGDCRRSNRRCAHPAPTLYRTFSAGLGEAGFYPGILLYLTYWFRRREQAQVIALFMTGVPISNILGAPLSGLILDHVHSLGISSWRWLMVLEGLPVVIFGVFPQRLQETHGQPNLR
jgi:MFS transporter, ACS family, tartrate transporter